MNTRRIEKRPFSVAVPDQSGERIAEYIPIEVEMEWDEELQDWLLPPGSLRMIEDTKARHMGLMLPDELKALRQRLDLSQAGIGDLLQIGAKTWTRWETGRQRPSRSINLLLRALNDGELSVEYLQRNNGVGKDWRKVVSFHKPGNRALEPFRMDRLWNGEPRVSAAESIKGSEDKQAV